MSKDMLSLGIDTSNYKTSVAVTAADGEIIFNYQSFLDVKSGERGLRQSEALFQHVQKLPGAIEQAFNTRGVSGRIGAVAVSSRPRPVEGSYMPVFTAGMGAARAIAAALGVPLYELSHQEGHIEAVKHYSAMSGVERLICFHFSGGTTEALLYDENENILEIIGGSLDLAYGQVLDRVGVAMGYGFPCGREIDRLALNADEGAIDKGLFKKITVKDGFVNLSGIETQCQRILSTGGHSYESIAASLMDALSRSVLDMTIFLSDKCNIDNFLYAGGVSCSHFLRNYLDRNLPSGINTAFGSPELSSDNAVGISLLGGKRLWL